MAITREEVLLRLSKNTNSFFSRDTPGFIVIHQNMSARDQHKSMQQCEQVKARFTASKEWLEFKEKFPNWAFILLPTNEYESYVEIFCENAEGRKDIESFVIERLDSEPKLIQNTEELRKKAKDYVKLMLGAPVITPMISDEQLDMCYNLCINYVHQAFKLRKYFDLLDCYQAQTEDFLFEGILAHAMIITGQITTNEFKLVEGAHLLDLWKKKIRPEEVEVTDEDLREGE